jgi:uncharacterized membrane protein YfcA
MTPLLMLFFKVPAAIAVGTDLLYASITKSVGIFKHQKLGHIEWPIVKDLMTGSVPAAILTSFFLSFNLVQEGNMTSFIEVFLGIALIVTSVAIFFQPLIINKSLKRPSLSEKKTKKHNYYLGYNIGLYCDTHFSWGWCYWGDDASHFISEAANKKNYWD